MTICKKCWYRSSGPRTVYPTKKCQISCCNNEVVYAITLGKKETFKYHYCLFHGRQLRELLIHGKPMKSYGVKKAKDA